MTCIKDRPRTPDHLGGIRELRQDRPALLVSSTSWTEDEDFGMLLRSLSSYERKARDSDRLPRLLVVITGKGPLRDRYMNQVVQTSEHERWRYVRCLSLWLAAEDYPRLLGGFHQSTESPISIFPFRMRRHRCLTSLQL
jgi:hypothetical protein